MMIIMKIMIWHNGTDNDDDDDDEDDDSNNDKNTMKNESRAEDNGKDKDDKTDLTSILLQINVAIIQSLLFVRYTFWRIYIWII